MSKRLNVVFDFLLLLIITVPAFLSLLNNQYFSMHDDQHIVRLFLLDQGIKQGYLYPRWVDGLGFGFGYPLYNFYPPLIYYLGEFFHLIGFSFIWSIKLVFITGFYLSAVGIFLLVKKLTNKIAAYLSSVLYIYFFYHAVLIYVRGALAEFFSLAVLPFVFLFFDNLANKNNKKNVILFGIVLTLLVLTHPLIAIPSVFFLIFFFVFYLFNVKNKKGFIISVIASILIGISLSAFFWLPSFMEKKYTLTDKILTSELANYKLHYICPMQFIYSPWGYGGSGAGCSDGMTFQLGKIHIALVIAAIVLSFIYFIFKKRYPVINIVKSINENEYKSINILGYFYFFLIMLISSLFMTTGFSSFIWDRISYLWYLQFPWRFMTFTALFISIAGGYAVFFGVNVLWRFLHVKKSVSKTINFLIVISIILSTVVIYSKYFHPQKYISTNDKERTSFEEIAWRISDTSYEFVPKGVKTKKTSLGTTTLAINKNELPLKPYKIISGDAKVKVIKNNFNDKEFKVNIKTQTDFQLNTYFFPGWEALVDDKIVTINNSNDLKLINIQIPEGVHKIIFLFKNTSIRTFGNLVSLISALSLLIILLIQIGKFWEHQEMKVSNKI